MGNSKHLLVFFSGVISFILILSGSVDASSFPFRSVNPGDEIPPVSLSGSGGSFTLDSSSGKRAAIIFWNADGKSKKKRAGKALKSVAELQEFFKTKNVTTLVVNTGSDTPDIISEVMTESGLSTTVYIDSEKNAYRSYGIFVLPSIMLVDDQGKITAGLGYSRDLKKRLKGEIEVMIGEKDRAQFEKELHPETVEKSAEEKNSKRHFNLGETMIQRGQLEVAVKEFQKALEFDPGMTEANIRLGCLYLDLEEKDQAKENLAKGMEANPDSVAGQICQARIQADEGDVEGAADDLQFLLLRNGRDHTLHYALATMLEKLGKLEDAIKEYRSAYDLIVKKEMHK